MAAGPAGTGSTWQDLRPLARDADEALLLGLADEPDRQRQRPVGVRVHQRGLLVIGSGGSGKSTALRTLAAQARGEVVWVPASAEEGWDAVAALGERTPPPGTLIVIDDLDALGAALPPEYARELIERLERIVRGAGAAEMLIVASAQRLGGAVARLADLLPKRLVLATASRSEHIAAGGDPAHWAPAIPPGRGRLDGLAIQVATTPHGGGSRPDPVEPWHPRSPLTGFVMRRSPLARAALAAWERGGGRVLSLDEFASDREWAGAPLVVSPATATSGSDTGGHSRRCAPITTWSWKPPVPPSCGCSLASEPCLRTAHPDCPVPGC